MPALYHFTSQMGIEGILNDDKIRKGNLLNKDQKVVENGAVNLTSDPSNYGHGLPDGRIMSPDQAKKFKFSHLIDGQYFSIDQTRYRLKIDITPSDSNLIAAKDFHDQTTLLALEIAGYLPINSNGISEQETLQILSGFKDKKIIQKGATWWYYFDEISISKIIEVAMKLPNGEYVSGSPTDFFSLLKESVKNQNKKSYKAIE